MSDRGWLSVEKAIPGLFPPVFHWGRHPKKPRFFGFAKRRTLRRSTALLSISARSSIRRRESKSVSAAKRSASVSAPIITSIQEMTE